MRTSHFLPTLTILALPSPALAQNSSSNSICKDYIKIPVPVNASALVQLPSSGTPPWYFTVTLGDERTNTTADHEIYAYRSTPANSTAYSCTHLLRTLLPATGSGANGDCAGILSENCMDFLRRSMALTQEDVRRRNCPNLPSGDAVKRACDSLSGYTGGASTGPSLVSNSSCPLSRVPGPDQPPSGYDSSALFGVSGFGDDETDRLDPSKFTWYDKYVSQPMPWVVSAFQDGESRTSVVCVTPNRIAEGSRAPSTSGAERRVGNWGVVGVVAAVVVVMGI